MYGLYGQGIIHLTVSCDKKNGDYIRIDLYGKLYPIKG